MEARSDTFQAQTAPRRGSLHRPGPQGRAGRAWPNVFQCGLEAGVPVRAG